MNNLVVPRGNEVVGTNGIAVAVYTMNRILLLVMWALVVAIPCQERGLQLASAFFFFFIPRHFPWALLVVLLLERILELSWERVGRNACRLLRELHQMDKCARVMSELTDWVQFPFLRGKGRCS